MKYVKFFKTLINNIEINVFVFFAVTLLPGCLCDSIEPWLKGSIMEYSTKLEGYWKVLDDDLKEEHWYEVTIKKRKSRQSDNLQIYYIKVKGFRFIGTVHKINDIKFLQIRDENDYTGSIFALASRPTVSLWRIEYDRDNTIIWMPSFMSKATSVLKTMKDTNNKDIFIDTTANLQAYINNWTKNYHNIKDDIDAILPIILTRKGTKFQMPEEMKTFVPRIYHRITR